MALSSTEELIKDIKVGKMAILMDDEDRENEGDLVIAAESVRPQDINFMARFGRGLICLTLTREHCRRLNLPLMARNFYSSVSTNFTVSIEAAEGITTGISAADRALTIKKAVAVDASPSDLIQPGHVFPLMAHPGGVLSRAGHTEAGCDLAQLAGFLPASVIVEILKDDGSMARRPDLEEFADEHGLKIGTIADLIRYRTENEKTIECVSACELPTEYGTFKLLAYKDNITAGLHLAMVMGEIKADDPTLVRVHIENPVYDLTAGIHKRSRWPIREVLSRIAKEKRGVMVILCNQLEPAAIIEQMQQVNSSTGNKTQASEQSSKDLRTIGLGSQILADIGVRKMIVMSTPKKIHALSGFNLEVVDYLSG